MCILCLIYINIIVSFCLLRMYACMCKKCACTFTGSCVNGRGDKLKKKGKRKADSIIQLICKAVEINLYIIIARDFYIYHPRKGMTRGRTDLEYRVRNAPSLLPFLRSLGI